MVPSIHSLLDLPDDVLQTLASRAVECGYDAALIGELEGILHGQFDGIRLPLVRWHLTARSDPAATFARLFAYDDEVSREQVVDALGSTMVAQLEEAGLLDGRSTNLRAQLRMMPFEGIYLLADHPGHGETVMGPGPTTAELARACNYEGVTSVLDVGCGAGSLALLAAKAGCPRVLGVDISERAVEMARLNARLNRLAAEFRAGDLLAPARDERFSLVVSQPAFVIQPDDVETTTYLHGGNIGDELALRLISELPEQIAQGGKAILRVDTPAWPNQRLQDRVRAQLGSVSDAFHLLAIAAAGHSPDYQSIAYAAEADPSLGAEYQSLVRRYRAHIEKVDIQGHLSTLIILKRAAHGENPWSITLTPPGLSRASAKSIQEFEAAFALTQLSDQSLMEMSIQVSPDARLVEQNNPSSGQCAPPRIQFGGGLAQDQEVSDAVTVLLQVFGGGQRLDIAIQCFAERCEAEVKDVEGQVVSFVRDSLLRGLLKPSP